MSVVEIVPACDKPQEIGVLFSEYTDMLVAGDSTFREYLAIQHYDQELEHLEIKYGNLTGGCMQPTVTENWQAASD